MPTRVLRCGRRLSTLQDDYGSLDSEGQSFEVQNFELEKGGVLPVAQVRYNTYGKLNAARDNTIVVCHAFTGNSRLDQWWPVLFGKGKALDPSQNFIVCANMLGSCYGTTGPSSINPLTKKQYGMDFPEVTIRDSVRLHAEMLQKAVGVAEVQTVLGGSMGGMQALEWCLLQPKMIRSAVIIGCNASHNPWQIAWSDVQRKAISTDSNWQKCFDLKQSISDGNNQNIGLSLARQIAMITYRSAMSYEEKFGRNVDEKKEQFQVQSYLDYQVMPLFDAFYRFVLVLWTD